MQNSISINESQAISLISPTNVDTSQSQIESSLHLQLKFEGDRESNNAVGLGRNNGNTNSKRGSFVGIDPSESKRGRVMLEIGFRWKNTLLSKILDENVGKRFVSIFAESNIKLFIFLLPCSAGIILSSIGIYYGGKTSIYCYSSFVVTLYFLSAFLLLDHYIAIECIKTQSFWLNLGVVIILFFSIGDLFNFDPRFFIAMPVSLMVVLTQLVDAFPPIIFRIRLIGEIAVWFFVVALFPLFFLRLIEFNEKNISFGDLGGISHREITFNNVQLTCEVFIIQFLLTSSDLIHAIRYGERGVYVRLHAETIRNPSLNDC